MKTHEIPAVEALLKANERWCMNACSRYIDRKALKGETWTLYDEAGELSAVLVHAKQGLLPVRRGQEGQGGLPVPRFLRGLFGAAPVHSLQGRKDDVLVMETELKKIGLSAVEKVDFDLMCIDKQPEGFCSASPAGLVIRKPRPDDLDALVALQAAYEKEEVSVGREPHPAVIRLHTERIFANEQMLVAELGGRLIGKINTNAVSFTRYQIGGVYVHPDCRGRGIARRMAGEFAAGLVAQGRGISLFVKKSNPAARNVYRNIGFEILGSYRIDYF